MTTVGADDQSVGTTRKVESHDEAARVREAEVTLNVAGPGVAASIVRLTNAISIRLENDLKASAASSSEGETQAACKQQYDYISAQVSRENGLIHDRMTWTLQFNGFLFAALALMRISSAGEAKSAEIMAPWLGDFLLGALPLAGLGISVCGWLGVRGAVRQLHYLRSEYALTVQNFASEKSWPKPFGDPRASWYGTAPAQLSLATLCFLWSWLAVHRVWPAAVETYGSIFLGFLRDLPARIFS
jgi:hypothetical protein